LIQKQGTEEPKTPSKGGEYRKQDHGRTRILIIDDEPDITLAFRKALKAMQMKIQSNVH
jgi:hypothetical protein